MTDPAPGSGSDPIRTLVADDEWMVRSMLRTILEAASDIEVVAEAADGAETVELAHRHRPDVVLTDIRMPRMDGLVATEQLVRPGGPPHVVVLTTFDLDEYVHSALRAGASGFLLKDAGPEELLSAVRAVHRGDSVIAPSATRRLVARFVDELDGPATASKRPEEDPRLARLTDREVEVLAAVGRGRSNTEISAELFLAEATVKTHIGRVLAKADLRDRVHMVMLAYETGLVGVRPRS